MTAPARLLETVVAHPATVVEASAGTGKTYQLEHLVFELVAEGRALLHEILVVTFTERAASELVARIRATIETGLRGEVGAEAQAGTARGAALADPTVRARLGAARRSFDLASITTIHSFCQRLLTEEPFLTGRLLEQSQVDGRAAFGEAFRDGLRTVLATDPAHRPYLAAHLRDNQGVDRLEELLYKAATARGRWAFPHVEGELAALGRSLLAGNLALLELAWKPVLRGQSGSAFRRRLDVLWPALASAEESGDWLPVLAVLDDQADANFYKYLDCIAAAAAATPALRKLGEDLTRLSRTPTMREAIVQRLLPVVVAEVERRKIGQGHYDFDDMIGAVARALDDEVQGEALGERLRRRYRYALIDEAQDTERTQWRIFERAFLLPSSRASGPTPVVLIGDPKQAIYSFRGADVRTYVAARTAIRDAGGAELALDRNFRSAPEVVRAVNAILDQRAAPPYFTDPQIAYDHPVTSQRTGADAVAAGARCGVTLFKLNLPENPPRPLRVLAIKRALRSAITERILRLRREQPELRPSSIFVLTRTNVEAREVGAALGEAGIACSYYKQEGLWKLREAEHVRALLCAIADPADRMARLHAWLTPFFGATLRQLEALGEPPGDHPLVRQLYDWKALADARDYPALWASVFESNGLGARHVLARPSRRRLGLYRQIADELLAEAAARPLSIAELAATVGRFAAQFPVARGGAARDLDIQRADLDDGAVQIMTMHRSKGLEAAHVFLYGALTTVPIGREVHLFRQGDERVFCAGRPRDPTVVELIKSHRSEDDQRLLYVAMTRARDHLYMPYFPDRDASDDDPFSVTNDKDHGDYVAFQKITGPFRHVNQRLRALAAEPARFAELFQVKTIPFPAPERAAAPDLVARIEAWSPPPSAGLGRAGDTDGRAEAPDDATLARLRADRRGFFITSYSRLKDAEGGYQPPVLDEDEEDAAASFEGDVAAPGPADGATTPAADAASPGSNMGAGDAEAVSAPASTDLPGGAATGLFLHAVLEKVALGALPPLVEWERAVEVRELLEAECRRWDRDPRHLGAAARMVHAALTAPIELPGARTPLAIATAARVRREVDFLFPVAPERVPAAASDSDGRLVLERGFVRGVLDVLFEHEGRACFADWKSDALPDFSPAAVAAHVAANYDLQIRIYTVAIVRLLGVKDEADYERRFGGLAYLFLRALGAEPAPNGPDRPGIFVGRPSYAQVQSWDHELTHTPAPLPASRRID